MPKSGCLIGTLMTIAGVFLACSLLCTPGLQAYSEKTTWENDSKQLTFITDIEGAYTYSDLKNSDSLSGGTLDALLAASWKLNENRFFIVKYDGGYEKKLDFYSDDIGQKERSEYQEHTITPMLRFGLGHGSRLVLIPSVFYTGTLNKDNESSKWSNGLYNYHDIGGGIDFQISRIGFGQGKGLLTIGIQYYKRHYPNFISLLDLASESEDLGLYSALDTERDEKDYGGILAMVEYIWASRSGFSWRAEYSLLYKRLDDKKVVNLNGQLSDTNQYDHLHSFSLQFSHSFINNLTTDLKLNTSLNRSNQNFYDGLETYDPSNDVVTKNYYDYVSYGFQPEISYRTDRIPITISFSYSFSRTDYNHRRAQVVGGAYKGKKQWETLQSYFFELEYTLSKQWKLFTNWRNTRGESNNDDERYYTYDYTLNAYSIGASYQF